MKAILLINGSLLLQRLMGNVLAILGTLEGDRIGADPRCHIGSRFQASIPRDSDQHAATVGHIFTGGVLCHPRMEDQRV